MHEFSGSSVNTFDLSRDYSTVFYSPLNTSVHADVQVPGCFLIMLRTYITVHHLHMLTKWWT